VKTFEIILIFTSDFTWDVSLATCSDKEKTTDAARLRKVLSKTAAPLGYLQKAKESWSDSSKESLDLLLDAHFPESQQTGHPPERSAGEGIKLDLDPSDRNMK